MLDREAVLAKVSETEIFERYLGLRPDFYGKFRNPLRDDKKASCTFRQGWSRIFFNDYSYPDFSGDCFHIVRKAHGDCDFYSALQIINRDFNLGIPDSYENCDILHKAPLYTPSGKKYPVERCTIKVKTMPFLDTDLEYWKQGLITEDILNLYQARCVLEAWINDLPYHKYSRRDPIYAYIFDSGIKLYRPFANSDFKWRNSASKDELQGYKQLPRKGDLLIITKSLKDVMSLRALGFAAVAPQSENIELDDEVVAELKKRFKRIVVFYDNDAPGVENCTRFTNKHNLEYFNIPKNVGTKDAFETLQTYDADTLLTLMAEKNLIPSYDFS